MWPISHFLTLIDFQEIGTPCGTFFLESNFHAQASRLSAHRAAGLHRFIGLRSQRAACAAMQSRGGSPTPPSSSVRLLGASQSFTPGAAMYADLLLPPSPTSPFPPPVAVSRPWSALARAESGRGHPLRGLARVTLFEAGDYFGGHTHTVDITLPTASGPVTHGVDTGFLVLNERTLPPPRASCLRSWMCPLRLPTCRFSQTVSALAATVPTAIIPVTVAADNKIFFMSICLYSLLFFWQDQQVIWLLVVNQSIQQWLVYLVNITND